MPDGVSASARLASRSRTETTSRLQLFSCVKVVIVGGMHHARMHRPASIKGRHAAQGIGLRHEEVGNMANLSILRGWALRSAARCLCRELAERLEMAARTHGCGDMPGPKGGRRRHYAVEARESGRKILSLIRGKEGCVCLRDSVDVGERLNIFQLSHYLIIS